LSTRLISVDGKTLCNEKGNAFSVSQSGVYILQVQQASGTQVKKIIIK
jgi:hypothetical protein